MHIIRLFAQTPLKPRKKPHRIFVTQNLLNRILKQSIGWPRMLFIRMRKHKIASTEKICKEVGHTTIGNFVCDFSNAVHGLHYFCADAFAAQRLFDPHATFRLATCDHALSI